MESDRERLIEVVFLWAIELEPQERGSYLEDACRGDRDLLERVEKLLRHAEAFAPGFLEGDSGDGEAE